MRCVRRRELLSPWAIAIDDLIRGPFVTTEHRRSVRGGGTALREEKESCERAKTDRSADRKNPPSTMRENQRFDARSIGLQTEDDLDASPSSRVAEKLSQ